MDYTGQKEGIYLQNSFGKQTITIAYPQLL